MTANYHPLRTLLLTVSGWVHREQQRTIEYLLEENRVLKEQFKGKRRLKPTFFRDPSEPTMPVWHDGINGARSSGCCGNVSGKD